jgi:phage FluMu protein Com
MPEERIRVRCSQCNQLIGVAQKKIGAVISCPRCKAELLVPNPEETPAGPDAFPAENVEPSRARSTTVAASPVAETRTLPSFMEQIAAAIPDDLASLRPEDIRVEAEFVDLVITTTPPVETPPAAEPTPSENVVTVSDTRPTNTAQVTEPLPITPPDPPAAEGTFSAILPEINIEPPTILPKGHELRPMHEVVLQPATVLAWSLLVLLSLPMAFLAGLLIGHFVWK